MHTDRGPPKKNLVLLHQDKEVQIVSSQNNVTKEVEFGLIVEVQN